MSKILHREVMRLHDAWANAMTAWGEDNLDTVRKAIRYREAREQWEREHGKPFVPRHRKGSA